MGLHSSMMDETPSSLIVTYVYLAKSNFGYSVVHCLKDLAKLAFEVRSEKTLKIRHGQNGRRGLKSR